VENSRLAGGGYQERRIARASLPGSTSSPRPSASCQG
jgi:hypothetical protein